MNPSWMAWMGSATLAPRVFVMLMGAAIRGGVVLVLAAAVVHLWPRASAAQRHVVWAVVCCSLLVLPVLPLVVPAWHVSVPVLPATVAPVVDVVNSMHRADPPAVSMAVTAADRDASRGLDRTVGRPQPAPVWLLVCLGVWGSGTLVVLTVLMDNQRRMRRLVSDALPLTDARMLAVLARARSTARVTRRVPVKLHVSTVPLVCGVLRPAIVLPASACAWGEDRLYNILLHELAHVRRYDCLTQTVAFLACAFYWCNPLVWLAVRRLQTEQEQACDDVVLAAGGRPHKYATDLLELTQAFQPTSALLLTALPFARPSELQTRMQSIVDRSRHRSLVSHWGALAVWGAGLGIMYPLAGLTPQLRNSDIRPLIPTMEHGKMNTIKQTAMVASAAAGLLAGAPVSTQAQPLAAVDSQAFERSEDATWAKQSASEVIDGVRYYHDNDIFLPMADTRFHFVVIDGDNAQVVYNSETDQAVCFPDEFLRNTDRSYYDEPSHTRLTNGWTPAYVRFSMVFHWKYKKDQFKLYDANHPFYHPVKFDAKADPFEIEDCSWIKKSHNKSLRGYAIDTAVFSGKHMREHIRSSWSIDR